MTLLLEYGGRDHLIEGVVFAFSGWCNVHVGGAYVLPLEAGLQQMRHLGLLKIINRHCELVKARPLTALSFTLKLSQLRIHVAPSSPRCRCATQNR